MNFEIINPEQWPAPVGYSNAILVPPGKQTLYLGGQVAFDETGAVVGAGDLVAQFRQTLANLKTVCECAGASLSDLVKLTIFVQDRDDYRAKGRELGRIYREFFGKHYPAMTLVEVARFYESEVLLEIEGTAVF